MNEDNDNIPQEGAEDDDQFSNDPEEQLRIENELLRLKLQAETGADLQHLENVPPDVENAFLNNILAFERQLDQVKEDRIYHIIGEPKDFKQASELNDEQLSLELKRLNDLLEQFQIEVDYGTDYPDRLKYKFITEELFEHETQRFDIPDMIHHFIYEEFHPNHTLTLEGMTEDFLEMWLDQKMEPEGYLFGDTMVSQAGHPIAKEVFLQRIQHLFDSFLHFSDGSYSIESVTFEMTPHADPQAGFGSTEGFVSYRAVLESKEEEMVKGPFRLYMQYEEGYWALVNAVMPGFEL